MKKNDSTEKQVANTSVLIGLSSSSTDFQNVGFGMSTGLPQSNQSYLRITTSEKEVKNIEIETNQKTSGERYQRG